MKTRELHLFLIAILFFYEASCLPAVAADLHVVPPVIIPETTVFQSAVELCVQLDVSAVVDFGAFDTDHAQLAGLLHYEEYQCLSRSGAFRNEAATTTLILDAWCIANPSYRWQNINGVIVIRSIPSTPPGRLFESLLDTPIRPGNVPEGDDKVSAITQAFSVIAKDKTEGKNWVLVRRALNGFCDWLRPFADPTFSDINIQANDSLISLLAKSIEKSPHHLWFLSSVPNSIKIQITTYAPDRTSMALTKVVSGLSPTLLDVGIYPNADAMREDAIRETYRRIQLDRPAFLAELAKLHVLADLTASTNSNDHSGETLYRLMAFRDPELNGMIWTSVAASSEDLRKNFIFNFLPKPKGVPIWNLSFEPLWSQLKDDHDIDVKNYADLILSNDK